MTGYRAIPASIDLPKMEHEVLSFWESNAIFHQSVKAHEGQSSWTFFEGPPTANGTGPSPKILRPGAISIEDIKGVTGLEVESPERSEVRVSGSLDNHYAPAATVLLDIAPQPGDGFIALAEIPTPAGVVRLAEPKSADQFAYLLYAALREADTKELKRVVVTQPQGSGISIAIRDRLKRAAAGR